MMKRSVRINPAPLSGQIRVMPSKSVSHRLAVCAALAGDSRISNLGLSEDVLATCGALRSLGYAVARDGDVLTTGSPLGRAAKSVATIDCGESGSTLRFLLPLGLDGLNRRFTGRGRLLARPMDVYADLFGERGVRFVQTGECIEVRGVLESGTYRLPGDVSSQFVSGLLFALPLLAGDSRIEVTTPLQSEAYVALTLQAMAEFGVRVERGGGAQPWFAVPGGQRYRPADKAVEGDFSHASFWLAAGLLGGGMRLSGLNRATLQGDAAIVEIVRRMGADVRWSGEAGCETLDVAPSRLYGLEIEVSQVPDLFPILAVLACAAEGETRLVGAERLRIKESDRLHAMALELIRIGADVEEGRDSLTVRGGRALSGGFVDAHRDHRVAMSLAVTAALCEDEIRIDDADCVNKSAPDFWHEFSALGGRCAFEEV